MSSRLAAVRDSAPPAGKREQTKAANRAAILEAGRKVFAERGYDAATVRDIVRETSLASGTFYNYFPDKESVFRALIEDIAAELRTRLREARAAAPDLEHLVGDAYRAYFGMLAEDPQHLALLRRNGDALRAMFGAPVLVAGVDELLADLNAAIARGDMPPLDTDYMAGAMAGAGLEIGLRMLERDPIDVEGATAFATGLFLGGIQRLARERSGD